MAPLGRQLGDVALLAVDELGEHAQAGLVDQRVEAGEVDADRRDQRRLELAVGDLDVLARGGLAGAVEQRRELVGRRAGVLARRELVEAAADLADRARVVVQVVAEQRLDVEARLEREVPAREVDELAQHVQVVAEARRGGVDVVAHAWAEVTQTGAGAGRARISRRATSAPPSAAAT